jgi:hypothetical protein
VCRQKNQDAEYAVSCKSTSIPTLFEQSESLRHDFIFFPNNTFFLVLTCGGLIMKRQKSPKFDFQTQLWPYFCRLMQQKK